MSILQVDNLEGPDWSDFKILMEGSSHLNVNGSLEIANTGQFCLPRGTTSERPASPTAGMIRYNIDNSVVEYYNGSQWKDMPAGASASGLTPETAAASASQLFSDGIVTSGKSLRYITTSAGVKQVWCDFDTLDEDGNSGWMLVAKFERGNGWGGGDGFNVLTSAASIDGTATFTGSSAQLSCNFYDMPVNQFRVTSNADAESDLGSSAQADWYYNWNNAITWKEVWAPAAGKTIFYRSAGSVPRFSLRKFDNSYNIKYTYNNPSHKYNNISDYGYTEGTTTTADYTYANVGGSSSPEAGFFDIWYAISNPGQQFEMFRVGRSANYASRSGGDVDGTLGIPISGSSSNQTGQDVDGDVSVKVGRDDNVEWGAASSSATSVYSNKTIISDTPLYWWIK
ncbi:hypothetical protein S-MbCM100_038 [Synechococcus phage S-MbCM100]|uniref:Sericin 1-like protein n=2 Tax=Acionnavirus monteraybay TaxID=2734078 RepID=A0A0E3EL12_9CAUD|nr:hypothetical protein S-MbCM100_038 [Synechococcus phage S-MbCM100]AIX14218.1 hypothetical protein Syn7803C42_33 [Synechococcus phage ACG-2014a]AHB80888.1 hypothetical protein S-MbCM100_038 [Synechococcus phage S-MbCM100]AIX15082.1 hypothetical protein Syn7803C47_33 [Synechococcus phage ACG-2014a]AIX15730.1 hypothetical protein Syn7803C53_33 [Synechococcus phage ACG-2014a]AIX17049.1 hypothetical protein Syn7803C60_33 [Synechococcus phage ACG-2014a]